MESGQWRYGRTSSTTESRSADQSEWDSFCFRSGRRESDSSSRVGGLRLDRVRNGGFGSRLVTRPVYPCRSFQKLYNKCAPIP